MLPQVHRGFSIRCYKLLQPVLSLVVFDSLSTSSDLLVFANNLDVGPDPSKNEGTRVRITLIFSHYASMGILPDVQRQLTPHLLNF